ncbi:MAG: 50S ribosomal protein L23 [Fimbriimonadaceae bacterium]|nr:50S ribosomal protein L23 [Fimbriimonadaceae bacterium]
MIRDPHTIIIKPFITERSVSLSYGDHRIEKEEDIQRQYTFIVATDANKIQIKSAFESIYNIGRKDADKLVVEKVRTITIHGKTKKVRTKARAFPIAGKTSVRKKAVITLKKGQLLEEYGV